MTPTWTPYEETKWNKQPLPPERRFVLVQTWPTVRDGLVRVRARATADGVSVSDVVRSAIEAYL